MSESLASFIATISANTFSDVFILAIGIVFVLSLALAAIGRGHGFVQNAPNLLTSMGILGTFAGIVVGLMEFDPSNIDGSIELLLAGLKTAFLTSLVGMLATIFFKILAPFIQKAEAVQEGVGPEEIHAVMSQQLALSEELVQSIRGNEESSLASQVRLLRSDVSDGNKLIKQELSETNVHQQQMITSLTSMQSAHSQFSDRLWLKMDEFGEMLSKSATEQVINALKEVIVDFNNSLTEQFGENFKRLDESVKKLVDWQENYRLQLEDMAQKYQLGVDAISATEKSVSHISERTVAIPETMEKLHSVMELGHGQVTELEHRLEAFKELRDKAVNAMPEIEKHLDETMSAISSSVTAASTHYESMLTESKAMMESFNADHLKAAQSFNEAAENNINTMSSELKTALNNINDELTSAVENISEDLVGTAENTLGKVSAAVETTNSTYVRLAQEANDTIDKYSSTNKEFLQSASDHIAHVVAESRNLVEEFSSTHSSLTENLHQSALENIGTMNSGIQQAMTTFSDEMVDSVEAIGDVMISNSEKAMVNVSNAVDSSSQTFEKMNTESNQLIERYSQDYHQALASYSEAVKSSVALIKDELGEGANIVADELKQGAIEIGGKLAQSAEDITNNVGDASGRLQSIVEHITHQTEEIKEHLRLTMVDLNESVRDMVINLKEQSSTTVEILSQGNDALSKNTQQTQQHMVQGINELQNRLEGVLEEVFEAQVREVKRTFESLEDQIIESVGQTGQAVEKQVEVLDLQMQQEINRVINEMGQGLATVTQQFTRDYGKLTNEMKTVVSNVHKMAV
ncbi:hypothetical protein [Photobacterium rosenbergii]|uniref:hypothetical protein n=1 Tax=Photobacterium rosenbergii TaxID=294936 RepID=UPI001C9A07ED|nr:hypothetical protein [Photobacterium rosenbergii]MBY5946830.1 hypothetical protein [Photobacterium rosenbergii]